ncbi:MAG: YicC/YloC family endoribonuclease [Proteiniphilum sp.]|nr:YicC family protein [Proteiniphilum sp.]NCD13624.1 YicC family protein [Bacteroidia bacterium]HHT34311.1 YicC family protein [Bacteroidales bacterium]MDD2726088.1 YicC family protein [Proteiniphilum sp.]MDD3332017.1 YicC family protein [Proteiniphilum sp.]
MIHSMTGYGRSVAELPNKRITVEIRSLNSKQFDLSARIPSVYREKELILRNLFSRRLERGKVDLTMNVDLITRDVSSKIDPTVLRQYHQELSGMADEMGVAAPADWFTLLLRLPDVMKQENEILSEEEWLVIEKAVDEALEGLIRFRRQEGEMLQKVLTSKIEAIRSLLAAVEPYETERTEKIKSRLYEALANLEGVEVDRNRLEQEMIYYLEKLDVNEEKTRLAHHLDYFTETLHENSSQGKKLGFIAQEIGREINTLGSKSNQSGMQRIVVQMKDELEQIKEQILNVL